MKTIWKFPLEIADKQSLMMPGGAEILCAQMQLGVLSLWALVETKNASQQRTFEVFGTGHPVNDDERRYISTTQAGPFVWHIFERL